MFSKVLFQLSRRNAVNQLKRRPMSSVPAVKEPHMNDFPAPYEPFAEGFKRRQVGNNFVLVAGITFFTLTTAFVFNSGVIVPNLTPPKKNLGE